MEKAKAKRAKRYVLAIILFCVLVIAIALLFIVRIPVPPLRVALLYHDRPIENTAQYFEQPLIYSLEFSKIDVNENPRLSRYDLVVIDGSVAGSPSFDAIVDELRSYANSGGRTAMTYHSRELLERLCPESAFFTPYTPAMNISFLWDMGKYNQIGQIFVDYMHYFASFADYEHLRDKQAGLSLLISENTTPIVCTGDQAPL